MKSILSALLLLSVAAAVLAETCPEDIAPCTCDGDLGSHGEIDIECDAKGHPEMLELDFTAHFAKLRGKKVGQMFLYDIPFKRVPTDLFQGLHVRGLYFQNCELEALADKDDDLQLQGLEDSLEELSLNKCFMYPNELKHLKLSHLKNLTDIDFYQNYVLEVQNEWFQDGPGSLEEINFGECQLKSVGDKAFSALPNLQYITFSGNDITVVGRSMVARPAMKLKSIVVNSNRISSIPEDSFDDMPALTDVDLSNNVIRRLPEATWSRVWGQLDQLYLDGNPLVCSSHIDWVFGRKRPRHVSVKCDSPRERKGQFLDNLIDDYNRKNETRPIGSAHGCCSA